MRKAPSSLSPAVSVVPGLGEPGREQGKAHPRSLPLPLHLRLFGPEPDFRGPIFVALAYFAGAEAAFYVGTLSDKIFAP